MKSVSSGRGRLGSSGAGLPPQRRRGAEETQSLEMERKTRGEHAEGAEASSYLWDGLGGLNRLTEQIIGAAMDVHRHLGPGLLESAYEECLCYELNERGIRFEIANNFVESTVSLD